MHAESLHKYGSKQRVGWGPIKENIVAAALWKIGIIEKILEKKEIKIWDPFCGSGTIILEFIS
jgi:23S rRNA (guanine2445-N2)-methyltransferase / 23S rRNA (guanine2069-N7)-methyltransferase